MHWFYGGLKAVTRPKSQTVADGMKVSHSPAKQIDYMLTHP